MWQAQIFTLYPENFPGPLNQGLYGKALSNKIWELKVVNIRDSAEDKHKTVDDNPFGGGSGMLLLHLLLLVVLLVLLLLPLLRMVNQI